MCPPSSIPESSPVLQEITLAEALCGTSFTIKHLDDRMLKVTSAAGEVIKPDSWKCIQDEGMPEHGRPYEHGNLYIQFHVKFPESLSKQQVDSLQQTLGNIPQALPASNGAASMEVDNVEEVISHLTNSGPEICQYTVYLLFRSHAQGPELSFLVGMSKVLSLFAQQTE